MKQIRDFELGALLSDIATTPTDSFFDDLEVSIEQEPTPTTLILHRRRNPLLDSASFDIKRPEWAKGEK